MASKPQYIQDLISQGKVHAEQLANLRHETDDLGSKSDLLKEAVADIRKDIALIKQKSEDQADEIKKWDGRWWYLVGGFILSLLALVSSLVVALVKK